MGTASGKQKKRVETIYVEEARRTSQVIPRGELLPHERPDFLLRADGRTLGIEVTELCREEPRAEGAKLANVAGQAKRRYNQLASNVPVEVSAVFAPRIERLSFNQLVNSLVGFVHAHRDSLGCFHWNDCDLPDGYSSIAIHGASESAGRWRTFKAFDTTLAPRDLLQSRIDEKNLRLPGYRRAADEVWLLLINDRFLGPGEVYVRADYAAEWTFHFDFEKVLLFMRDPGRTGEVVELRRELVPHKS